MASVGISFGSHFSSIASASQEVPLPSVFANQDGERQTPVVVAYTPEEILVGSLAKVQKTRKPETVAALFRDSLGTDTEIIEKYNAEEVTATYLSRLGQTALSFLGKPPVGCCLSVPVYFSEAQKAALVKVTQEKLGFPLWQLVKEPIAACYAYHHNQSKLTDKNVLVFDLGASSLTVSLVALRHGTYTLVEWRRDTEISGNALDELLLKHMAEEFVKKTGLQVTSQPRSQEKLRQACEETKKTLSSSNAATCWVESLMHGRDLNISINRMRFDMLARGLYSKCDEVVLNLLKDLNVSANEIDEVVLVGGCAKIPKLKLRLKQLFREDVVFQQDLEADEVIAAGCAAQALLLSKSNTTVLDQAAIETPHLSRSLGVLDAEGKFHCVIPRFTPLPCLRRISAKAPPEGLSVTVCEQQQDQENTTICQLVLKDLQDDGEVELTLEVTKEGQLDATIKESKTERSAHCKVSPN